MTQKLEITRPDDWHLHLRQGSALTTTVEHAAKNTSRAIVMPNTIPPILDLKAALEYRAEIYKTIAKLKSENKLASGNNFQPLMTLYLTDQTTEEHIKQVIEHSDAKQYIVACKLYPQGATTNSSSGVSNIEKIYPTLEAMEKYGMPLLIHGEVTEDTIDIFDRENVFIDKTLIKLRENFPELQITLEHITTKHAVDFVLEYKDKYKTAATITPHHLLLNRNDLLVGGIKPHYYCLPILKDKTNQEAIAQAALSGKSCFFAGSDSAPHAKDKKQSACGCAGIYYGPNMVLYYAHFFDNFDQISKLEAFVSFYGADYYNLARNNEKITLLKKAYTITEDYTYEDTSIVPFYNGKQIDWCFQ